MYVGRCQKQCDFTCATHLNKDILTSALRPTANCRRRRLFLFLLLHCLLFLLQIQNQQRANANAIRSLGQHNGEGKRWKPQQQDDGCALGHRVRGVITSAASSSTGSGSSDGSSISEYFDMLRFRISANTTKAKPAQTDVRSSGKAATRLTLQAHENAWLVRWGDALTEKIAAESSESVAAHYQNGNLADSLHTRLARLATEQGYLSKVIPGAQF